MVPPIGDAFPEKIKVNLAKENFRIGCVLRFFCSIAKKDKWFIYIGNKYDGQTIALVHINTEINDNVFPTPELKAEHYFLEKTDERLYLKWDSYVNCSQFMVKSKEEVFNLLATNPSCHLGELSADDFKAIKLMIKSSRILRPAQKKEFGLFL